MEKMVREEREWTFKGRRELGRRRIEEGYGGDRYKRVREKGEIRGLGRRQK